MGDPMAVSVRHNSKLAAAVALAAAVFAVAWFARALQTGSLLDWAWCLVVAAVSVLQLLVVRDSRAPLMVADEHGVRVRRGVTWSGLRWQDIENVEVTSPRSWLRDGQVVVHPRQVEGPLEEPADEARHGCVPDRRGLRRAPGPDHPAGVRGPHRRPGRRPRRAGEWPRRRCCVLTRLEPEKPEKAAKPEKPARLSRKERAEVRAALAESEQPDAGALEQPERLDGARRARRAGGVDEQDLPEDATKVQPRRCRRGPRRSPSSSPSSRPGRPRPAARAELIRDSVRMLPTPPPIPAQRAGDGPVRGRPCRRLRADQPQPAENAVIGPLIAAARHRARLSIDTLSERTRIRPHVLECIEVDDFAACGGDFYARGHLRTLARIFGLDAQQLLDLYDDHYATAEIEARQVFEAELATGIGGGVRAIRTGPRWSLLAACVLALAAVWGVARVFNDTPQELVSPAPGVVDSAGLAGSAEADAEAEAEPGDPGGDRCGGEPRGRGARPQRAHPVGRQARARSAPAGDRAGAVRRDRRATAAGSRWPSSARARAPWARPRPLRASSSADSSAWGSRPSYSSRLMTTAKTSPGTLTPR